MWRAELLMVLSESDKHDLKKTKTLSLKNLEHFDPQGKRGANPSVVQLQCQTEAAKCAQCVHNISAVYQPSEDPAAVSEPGPGVYESKRLSSPHY